jgi:hypothetical protein
MGSTTITLTIPLELVSNIIFRIHSIAKLTILAFSLLVAASVASLSAYLPVMDANLMIKEDLTMKSLS